MNAVANPAINSNLENDDMDFSFIFAVGIALAVILFVAVISKKTFFGLICALLAATVMWFCNMWVIFFRGMFGKSTGT